jgi:glycerate dehydrogenase
MKIVVLDGGTLSANDNPWTALEELGRVEIYDRSSAGEVLPRSREAQVLITNKVTINASVIEQATRLCFIAVSATGFDCVDVAAARRHGIPVANVPEYGTDSVAQFVFALLLDLGHHVGLHGEAVHAGEWAQSAEFCFWNPFPRAHPSTPKSPC